MESPVLPPPLGSLAAPRCCRYPPGALRSSSHVPRSQGTAPAVQDKASRSLFSKLLPACLAQGKHSKYDPFGPAEKFLTVSLNYSPAFGDVYARFTLPSFPLNTLQHKKPENTKEIRVTTFSPQTDFGVQSSNFSNLINVFSRT